MCGPLLVTNGVITITPINGLVHYTWVSGDIYFFFLHTYIYIYTNITPISGAITPYQRPCTLYMGNWGVITPIITPAYKWFLGPPSAWTPAG